MTGALQKGRMKAKIHYSFLKILTGSDLSRRRLPYMSARGDNPGPAVWLTACCHGDEVGGIVIIQEIFRIVRKSGLTSGFLHAFPLMNPIGFEAMSRHIPLSREDLNRSFPGKAAGTLGERLARIIFETIIQTRPALVIDLHTDWTCSLPYALIDATPPEHRPDQQPSGGTAGIHGEIASFALGCGLPVIRDSEILHRSLSQSLLREGIRSFTLEMGESYVINEKNILVGVKSISNLLVNLGMMDVSVTEGVRDTGYRLPDVISDRILEYRQRPYSSSSGILRFLAKPGDMVSPGQPVARIYNAFGKLVETMRAEYTAMVLGHADSSMAYPGMPVMAFGCLKQDQ